MGQTTAGKEKRNKERKEQVAAVTSAANQEMQNQIDQGNQMYGSAVSTAANEELINQGLASVGNYFEQQGGEFVKISKSEYKKKLASGATNLHTSYNVSTAGSQVLYGGGNPNAGVQTPSTPTAMGTGDSTGALTSVPISSQMLQSQNKMKGLMVGALSLAMPGIGATAMKLDATKALKDAATPETAHAEYMKKFKAKQKGIKPDKPSNIITDTLGVVKATLGGGDKKTTLGQ
tara:strand:+ start:1464 stop:2162 length:699 start_codon:yes stop_codon:yes gene_type:complete